MKHLTKLAHEFPQIREHVLPIITQESSDRQAALVKRAFTGESEQFVAWCVLKNDKVSAHDCQRLLDKLHVPMQEEGVAVTRGPLEKGEMVEVKADKNTNQHNTDVCGRRNKQVGSVFDVDGDALIIKFDDGHVERFEGKMPGASTGLYRYTPVAAAGNKASIEIVYLKDPAGKPTDKSRMKQIQEYVDKGMEAGENRSKIYYSGVPLKQAMGKNGYYFSVFSAQRDAYPTSINPAKGTILYIGIQGHRPGGWKAEFARMVAEIEEEESKE